MSNIEQSSPSHGTSVSATLPSPSAWVGGPLDSGDSLAWRDWLGVTASIACAVHCAAMPFVVGFLPLLGLEFFADPAFHQWMVVICLALAVLAFLSGWRRHRRWAPACIAVVGLSFIAVAAFAGPDNCCPSVELESEVSAANAPANGSAPLLNRTKQAANCQTKGCAACSTNLKTSASVTSKRATGMSTLWPWVTPFGGLLLIVAHVFNRQLTCRCCRAGM